MRVVFLLSCPCGPAAETVPPLLYINIFIAASEQLKQRRLDGNISEPASAGSYLQNNSFIWHCWA